MAQSFSPLEREILDRVQQDFPLATDPYAVIARDVGCTPAEAYRLIGGLRDNGVIRRIGGSFSSRMLGYTSVLVAARVDQSRIEAAAARAGAYHEVTHNYEREGTYNLWFTVIAEAPRRVADIVADVRRCEGVQAIHALPAIRTFKIRVVFSFGQNDDNVLPADPADPSATRSDAEPEPLPDRSELSKVELDDVDRHVIRRACLDIGSSMAPFREMAGEIGIPETHLLERLRAYKQEGTLRRFGAILRHQAAGYAANGMSVWNVPGEQVERVARRLAACPDVSHCYERTRLADWPYNLYAMIHSRTREDCLAIAARLSQDSGIDDYQVLFSLREFKKTSFSF